MGTLANAVVLHLTAIDRIKEKREKLLQATDRLGRSDGNLATAMEWDLTREAILAAKRELDGDLSNAIRRLAEEGARAIKEAKDANQRPQ